MAIKKVIISAFICTLFTMSFISCDGYEDNYDGPNANFHGTVTDDGTGEPFFSEQPYGFQIRFKEISWGPDAQPQSFYGKYDGSFNWDYLFGYRGAKYQGSPYEVATYEVELFDGAFQVVGTQKQTIEVPPGAKLNVDFKVVPFVRLTESHSLNGTELTVNYSMARPLDPTMVIEQAGVIISSQTKYLSANLNAGGKEDKYSKLLSASRLRNYVDGTVITETINLDPGKTYWIRTAAKAKGTDRWNYTEVLEIKVP